MMRIPTSLKGTLALEILVVVKLSKMVSRLQFLQCEGDTIFNTHKLRKRLLPLNFLRLTILGFMMPVF